MMTSNLRIEELRQLEMNIIQNPAVPESVLPILEILPVQMITLAFAAQTGREAGQFSLASKVTTAE